MALTGIVVNGTLYQIDYDYLANKPVDQYALDKDALQQNVSDALGDIRTLFTDYQNLESAVDSLKELSFDLTDIDNRLIYVEGAMEHNVLPGATEEDTGKVLSVNSDGVLEYTGICVPRPTIEDAGKVLRAYGDGDLVYSDERVPAPAAADAGQILRANSEGELVYSEERVPAPDLWKIGKILYVNAQGKIDYRDDHLPDISENTSRKILVAQGSQYVLATVNFLPNVSAVDAGKVLSVDEHGEWVLSTVGGGDLPNAEEASF